MKAAKDLIGRLQSTHSVLIHNMSLLCEAYVDLAYHDVSAFRNEKSGSSHVCTMDVCCIEANVYVIMLYL